MRWSSNGMRRARKPTWPTLDRILVDDWTVTHANGTTDTKAQLPGGLESGARKFVGRCTEATVDGPRLRRHRRRRRLEPVNRHAERPAAGRRAALHARLRETQRRLEDGRPHATRRLTAAKRVDTARLIRRCDLRRPSVQPCSWLFAPARTPYPARGRCRRRLPIARLTSMRCRPQLALG